LTAGPVRDVEVPAGISYRKGEMSDLGCVRFVAR
jgi:hypothetical protein